MAQDFRRTAFATMAVGLAEKFKFRFGSEEIQAEGPAPTIYRVEMLTPEGESTGGGKQSLQPIKLVPVQGTAIVVGSANQKDGVVEIRTHAYLAQQHAERFGAAEQLPITVEQYDALAKKMLAFFAEQGLKVVSMDARPLAPPPAPSRSGVSPMIVVALVIAVAVLAGAVVLLMTHHQ